MEQVPGREITEVIGEVIGVVARTRELRPDLRTGNPIDGYVTMLTESRQEAVGAAGGDGPGGGRRRGGRAALRLQRDHPVAERGRGVRHGGAVGAQQIDEVPEEETPTTTGERTGSTAASGDQPAGQWPPSSWPSSS